jgi:uncharacterized protein YndB with AHSA1/START domain
MKNQSSNLKIVRKFNVLPEAVFDALTNPDSMKVWWTEGTMFDIDLKIGGRWTIMRQEGNTIHIVLGEYLEIEKPNKLKYSYAMPQYSENIDTISIDIVADGEAGCIMTFEQVGKDIESELSKVPEGSVSNSERGWNQAFDLIKSAICKPTGLKIVREFNVLPEVVFDVLTNPDSMKIWWTKHTLFDIDLRVGGRWTIMRGEGEAIYIALGEYLEIEKPNKLIYSYAMPQYSENIDTISVEIIADSERGCTMIFEQIGKDIESELSKVSKGGISNSQKGWNQAFDLMEKVWAMK